MEGDFHPRRSTVSRSRAISNRMVHPSSQQGLTNRREGGTQSASIEALPPVLFDGALSAII